MSDVGLFLAALADVANEDQLHEDWVIGVMYGMTLGTRHPELAAGLIALFSENHKEATSKDLSLSEVDDLVARLASKEAKK